jgi:antitoxin HicB
MAAGITRAELARRLDMHRPQVDRLFDIDHASTVGQLEQACKQLGVRLALEVVTG